jgi:hypothetical protein
MHVLYFILLLLAVVAFVAAAFQVAATKVNLIALGLALAFAVPLIQHARLL